MKFRLIASLLAGLMLASPWALARKEVPAGAVIGQGKFEHRFQLLNPTDGQPLPNTRYRLIAYDVRIKGVKSDKGDPDSVIFGVTDAKGYTATVRLQKRSPVKKWRLNRAVGVGDFGESFHYADSDDNEGIGLVPYIVSIDGGMLYCGYSSANGDSAYIHSHGERNYEHVYGPDEASLTPADLVWCEKAAQKLEKLDREATPLPYHKALTELVNDADDVGEDLRIMIAKKWSAKNRKDDGSLDKLITPLLQDTERSDWLAERNNSLGYTILEDGHPQVAIKLIEVALMNNPDNPYALDSKGWALYQLGKPAEGLPWIARSMDILREREEAGDSTARRPLYESLVHTGEIHWVLGDKVKAEQFWQQAEELMPESSMVDDTRKRLKMDE